MPDLSTRYLGLPLKNPIVPSSTPLTRDAAAPLHLEDAGAAAIVMHSLFEEDVRNDERMIDRFLIHPESSGEASGHLPGRHDYESKLDRYLAQIGYLKERLDIPVVASLNGDSLSGWKKRLNSETPAAPAFSARRTKLGRAEKKGESLRQTGIRTTAFNSASKAM